VTPGAFLSADLLGPFPLSAKGNRMVIVVSDLMTRYVIAGALPNGTAEEVAEFLVDKVICVYGAFRVILTDNGMCFRAKLMSELSKTLTFQQRFTNPYSPECNGLTERFNGTLATMLSPFMDEVTFSNWDKNIPSVVFAYNTAVHATLMEVPYFLMFGRDPVLPMDLALRLPSRSLVTDDITHRVRIAFDNAKRNLAQTQEKMKKRFDVGRQQMEYRPGDIVLYDIPTRKKGEPDKLQPKSKGLFRVISKLSDTSYVIESLSSNKNKVEKVSLRRLRPYSLTIPKEVEVVPLEENTQPGNVIATTKGPHVENEESMRQETRSGETNEMEDQIIGSRGHKNKEKTQKVVKQVGVRSSDRIRALRKYNVNSLRIVANSDSDSN
jgi:ribosomal protein L21E